MGCVFVFGFVVVGSLLYLAVAWPYWLGARVAVRFGASDPSPARSVTGWLFESVFILVVLLVLAAVVSANRRSAMVAQAGSELATLEAAHELLVNTLDTCVRLRRVIASNPQGTSHPGLPAGETLLMSLDEVSLIEPRVESRGGPRVPTEVDEGSLLVSNKGVRFFSERKHVEWKFSRVLSQYEEEDPDRILWAVGNRKTVTGVGGSYHVVTIVKGLCLWASELPATPARASDYFEEQVRIMREAVDDSAQQIEEDRQSLRLLERTHA